MEDNDPQALADLAIKISADAKEAASLTQDALDNSKTADETLRLLKRDLSCFADQCEYLGQQLSQMRKLDNFVADDVKEKFRQSIRLTMEFWQKNAGANIVRLEKDFKRRASQIGSFIAKFDADPKPTIFNLDFKTVGKTMEGHMEDAEVIVAVFHL